MPLSGLRRDLRRKSAEFGDAAETRRGIWIVRSSAPGASRLRYLDS
jgi:hypothetical protein